MHAASAVRVRRDVGVAVQALVTALIVILAVRAWLVQPFGIVSGSMGPTLLGPHSHVVCQTCGWAFDYGLDAGQAELVVCRNCDHAQRVPDDQPQLPGEGLLVDRSVFRWRDPRRWEVVVFRDPRRAERVEIKRVVGMPGERITLDEGDVWANGQRVRKTLSQQQAVAQLVHDADHPSRDGSRWHADETAGDWFERQGTFVFAPSAPRESELRTAWLTYRHERLAPGSSNRFVPGPVEDFAAYDQTQTVVETHAMRDLALGCRLRLSADSELFASCSDGSTEFEVRFVPARQLVELRRDGRLVQSRRLELPGGNEQGRLWLSLFDSQLLAAWNGEPIFVLAYDRPADAPSPTARPFRLGATGGPSEVADLRVWRDLHYAQMPEGHVESTAGASPLPGDAFYVLGDNSRRSIDSRAWPEPGVSRHLLVGKPVLVYDSPGIRQLAGRAFRIPDFSRIRYIR